MNCRESKCKSEVDKINLAFPKIIFKLEKLGDEGEENSISKSPKKANIFLFSSKLLNLVAIFSSDSSRMIA